MVKKLQLKRIIDVNCYIIYEDNTCIIIDPGSDIDLIKKNTLGYEIKAIFLTHGHADHTNEIGKFKCPIYIYESELEFLNNTDLSCHSLLGIEKAFDFNKLSVMTLKDNQIIYLLNDPIKILHTPGHTRGSVSILYQNYLFSGDTLFKGSIGRTDFLSGSFENIIKSVSNILNDLDENIIVCPGHGENTTIKEEKEKNIYYLAYKKRF